MGSPSAGAADLHAEVFIGAFLPFERGKGTFAATTSTLVSGSSDAVLIDAQHIRSDVAALGDLIERTGRRVTTIYATHGHADHWYGAGELVRDSPEHGSSRLPLLKTSPGAEVQAQKWAAMFGDHFWARSYRQRSRWRGKGW